jgi:hypothetical protein
MNDRNKKLDSILKAVSSIQSGLLKVSNGENRQSYQVRVTSGEDNSLHCVISDDVLPKARIKNKAIHLIQKYHDDYFFITGHVDNIVRNNTRILSIAVNKACWYVRKRRGSVTWFSEKCIYEHQRELLRTAS